METKQKLAPDNLSPDLDRMLAEAGRLLAQGRLEEAQSRYRKVLTVRPDDPDVQNNLGIVYLHQGRLEQAARCFRRALELAPPHLNARSNLGIVLLNQGKLAEAEACFRRVLEIDPEHADANNNLGLVLMNQGRLEEAAAQFQKALAARPEHADALTNLGIIHLMQGKLEEAAEYLSRALAIKPEHPDAMANLGSVHQQMGNHAEAEKLFRKALALRPNRPELLNNLGVILLMQGRLDEAADYFRQALAVHSHYADAWNNLAAVAMRQGRTEEAKEYCQKALALNPEHADAHNNLGSLLIKEMRLTEAVKHLERALTIKPEFPEAIDNLGQVYLANNRFEEARECFRHALAIRPDYVQAINNLGAAYMNDRLLFEAEDCFRQALALAPDNPEAHNNLGAVLLNRGQLDEAVECFRRALELNPDHAGAINNLGQTLMQQGEIDKAIRCFKKALALSPKFGEPYWYLVNCRKMRSGDKEISQIEALLQEPSLSTANRIPLHFALGKAYDDIGDYDRAFANYTEGNRLHRKDMDARGKRLDMDQFAKTVDNIIQAVTPELFSGMPFRGSDSDIPVFVVGMFRSGTTLVEQIIASHSEAFGAGELKKISQGVASLAKRLGKPLYPEGIAQLDEKMLKEAAAEYLDYVTALPKRPVTRIVDKMPNNIWQLGLIALLFPNAKIIYCRRDPRDICLSCFFQRFTDEVYYATDLVDTGKYYLEMERIYEHWKTVLPVSILEVNYEQLVETPQREARRIIKFIGLDWEEQCLDFHRTRRPVLTASVVQVRQPIYKKSVKRWQRYAKHIRPLLEVLEAGHAVE